MTDRPTSQPSLQKRPGSSQEVTGAFIDSICKRLAENKSVRRNLPTWGRLHIDRQLPFLCIYRQPSKGDPADAGTQRLATSEASYLTCSAKSRLLPGLRELVRRLAAQMTERFGSCLILELWSAELPVRSECSSAEALRPRLRLVELKGKENGKFTERFHAALTRIKVGKLTARIETRTTARCSPKSLPPLLTPEDSVALNCRHFGLEIAPIYRDPESGGTFPLILRELRRQMTLALRRAFFDFTRLSTTQQPAHFHTLGRRAMVRAVWETDRLLAECSDSFDFLLQVTPVNAQSAWNEFQRNRFQKPPALHYRPLPIDPILLKRQLYKTPVERVEDPALAHLFREKLDELDRQITMLADLNTKRFVQGSVQLYGGVEDSMLELAEKILQATPSRVREGSSKGSLDAVTFARLAEEEIAYYRAQWPKLDAHVDLRSDTTGLMVSRGNLLVSDSLRIPEQRAHALLQHEIGTHVLTYHNGRAQKFRQLYSGLAGYETLQEGLAVLSEYLVGGLNPARLRLLAARVVAVRLLLDGARFVDTFRELNQRYRFEQRVAFQVALRTHRGGGLTKDAVYLRGLCQILDHLGQGGELGPLFVGKIAKRHIPIIRELQWRRVLTDPPLTPRYMESPDTLARLEKLRKGIDVLDLLREG